jgi:hypothetical protein
MFWGMYRFHHQGDKNQRARNNVSSNLQLKHTAKKCRLYVNASSRMRYNREGVTFVTLMIDAIHSSESSVPTIATRRYIPEDGILQ